MIYLMHLGNSYSCWQVADAAVEGCYVRWGTRAPRTSRPTYPPHAHFQAPTKKPQLGHGSVLAPTGAMAIRSWAKWQQRQPHTSKPLLLFWWTINLP